MKTKEIEYKGKLHQIPELARSHGLTPGTLLHRVKSGWDLETALSTPPLERGRKHFYNYHGQKLTADELAAMHGDISAQAIAKRIAAGMSVEQAVAEPKSPGKPMPIVDREYEIKPVPEKKKTWKPHKTAADVYKCSRCKYSEKAGIEVVCAYIILHSPPERRGCDPGKNCTRFKRQRGGGV